MFNPDLPDDEHILQAHVRKLASAKIKELEQKIEDEFGLKVQTGVELEFFGEKKKRAKHFSESNLDFILRDIPFYETVGNDLGWATKPMARPRAAVIMGAGMYASTPTEPWIGVVSGMFGAAYFQLIRHFARQYEVKLNNTQNGEYASLVDLADSVETVKERLVQGAAAMGMDDVSFESKHYPHTLNYQTCPSMHVNLSLWTKDGKNALTDPKLHAACQSAILDMQHDGSLLMLTTRNAYESLQKGYQPPGEIAVGHKTGGKSLAWRGMFEKAKRFESRLPRADADPYLTLLGNLAGLYEGLLRTKQTGVEAPQNRPIPRDMYEAYNRFDESTLCKRLLGDELHEATLKLFDKELSKDDILDWGTPTGHGVA